MNLEEYVGERVLVRRTNSGPGESPRLYEYLPGTVHAVDSTTNDVDVVLEDSGSTFVRVSNVLSEEASCHIISDHSPAVHEILMGSWVCVRVSLKDRSFVQGRILASDVTKCPPVFKIALLSTGSDGGTFNVSRVHIRLLRPPW